MVELDRRRRLRTSPIRLQNLIDTDATEVIAPADAAPTENTDVTRFRHVLQSSKERVEELNETWEKLSWSEDSNLPEEGLWRYSPSLAVVCNCVNSVLSSRSARPHPGGVQQGEHAAHAAVRAVRRAAGGLRADECG